MTPWPVDLGVRPTGKRDLLHSCANCGYYAHEHGDHCKCLFGATRWKKRGVNTEQRFNMWLAGELAGALGDLASQFLWLGRKP